MRFCSASILRIFRILMPAIRTDQKNARGRVSATDSGAIPHITSQGIVSQPPTRTPYTAECNKAPFMYEMKGALSGHVAPDRPVARLPRRHAPPDGAKHPPEPPVSRLFPCPEVAPGWCPFPTVKAFLLPLRESRKSLREFIFWFFSVHTLSTECRRLSARRNPYPPAFTQFIHRLPSVTRRIPDMVAVCNRTGVSAGSRKRGAGPPVPPGGLRGATRREALPLVATAITESSSRPLWEATETAAS